MPELGEFRGARRDPGSHIVGNGASVVGGMLDLVKQGAQGVLLIGGLLEHAGSDVDRGPGYQGQGQRVAWPPIDDGAIGEQRLRIEGGVGQIGDVDLAELTVRGGQEGSGELVDAGDAEAERRRG